MKRKKQRQIANKIKKKFTDKKYEEEKITADNKTWKDFNDRKKKHETLTKEQFN